jgi:hypothetical protein
MTGIPSEDPAGAASDGLVAALRRILRPLVRLLISRSVSFPLASSLLRSVYVDVAVREFPVSGKPQTDSRVTLLTGVHRKDVKRLRHESQPTARAPRAASLGSQLIARWLTLPEFLEADGAPKPLARLPRAAGETSFDSLVRSINTDIRPRVVLDEWQRLGIVHVDEEDRVCLDVQGFVPAKGSEEMAYFFGRNLHDHLATAVHNMLGEGAPLLERSVNYNNLSPSSVAELLALAQTRGMEVLRELNARALKLQKKDAHHPQAAHRVNVGLYLFTEERKPDENEESDK